MALPPRVERHLWLRFDTHDYHDSNIQDFEDRLRMEHTGADGQVLFFSHAWRRLFWIRGPLVREILLEFFSTCLHTKEEMDTDGFRAYWVESLRVIASKDDLRDYWTGILVLADPTPVEVAQMPQAAELAPRRVGDRLQRFEEEVHRLGTRSLMVALLEAHRIDRVVDMAYPSSMDTAY
ncbi:hypothetical protein Tco_0933362, partial [Tanacetum coccineum]